MPLFMKTTPPIPGDVTDQKYTNWIALTSVGWGASRDRGSQAGPPSSRKAPAPEVQDIEIKKYMDKASPLLIAKAMTSAGCVKNVQIDFVHQSPTSSYTFASISLDNVLFLKYDVEASYSGDGQLSEEAAAETYELNYTKITFTYIPLNAQGLPESQIVVSYDMSTSPPTLSPSS